ncbi:hypothetical protein Pla163_08240 [Planctomycetes bacterium Pla163]|uniref:Uncharacterized protein n=1 Tax=Rohdeia mirabilis TaxID=2528008 RepID=A0A518CWW7_9BACT|nr:hypothetical protein Pla163_08240 [Planctomycetes bacterium Pla163]
MLSFTRFLTPSNARPSRRPAKSIVIGLALALLGLPAAAAITSGLPDWFSQWTGGTPMMMSGESIGSLPSYLTPADTMEVPGATESENGLQLLPSLEMEVPFTQVFDAVPSADGNGYAFIGPGSEAANARVRVFGDVSMAFDTTLVGGRGKTIQWNPGPAFAGSKLLYFLGSASASGSVSVGSSPIGLPVDSAQWKLAFEQGTVLLILVRPDGFYSALELDRVGGALVAVQSVP